MSEHYNVSNVNLEAYGLSVTGQVRQANEDSCGFATVPNGDLFVVCDGMGGHVGGATASKIAVEQIIQHFKAQLYDNVYQALADALCRANIQILGEAAANPSLKGMGTTACIVLVAGNDAYIAHVGDSRIYLYEAAKKRLFRITKDHSFVQSLVDLGQLDDRDAEHHPRKNVIMKALGTKETLKPEVYESPVQPAKGDMFLICSDGLSGMVDDNGIEAILSSNASVEEKTDQLVANANVPGKGLDNITAQLIKVIDSPYPSSNHPDHNPRWRNELFGEVTQPIPDVPHTDPVYNMASPQTKKRMSPKWIALIIVGALLLLGGGLAFLFSGLNQPDLETIKEQIAQTEQSIEKKKEVIALLENQGKQEDGSYKRAQNELEELQKELNGLREDLNKRDQSESNIWKRLYKRWPFGNKGNEPGNDTVVKPIVNPCDSIVVDTVKEQGNTTNFDVDQTDTVSAQQQEFTIIATVSSVQAGTITHKNETGSRINVKYPSGDKVTLTATAADGYTFTNWTENGKVVSSKATAPFNVNRDRNLVANFKQKQKQEPKQEPKAEKLYTITVNASEGGTIDGKSNFQLQVAQGETCNFKATPQSGYNISHWTDNGKDLAKDQLNYGFTNVNEDHVVVAHFKSKDSAPKIKTPTNSNDSTAIDE